MHLLFSAFAIFIGYRIGLQDCWDIWHGPVAALIVMPVAYLIGFDPTFSVVGSIGLGAGFLMARV